MLQPRSGWPRLPTTGSACGGGTTPGSRSGGADPDARVLVVGGRQVRVTHGDVTWVAPRPTRRRVIVCSWASRPGGPGSPSSSAPSGPTRTATRSGATCGGLLPALSRRDPDDPQAPLVFHALGIAEWLRATRFCPRCARPLELRRAGHELVCDQGHVQFPRLDPAVIMTITSGEPGSPQERCLLGRQAVWPEGRYSTLAGFCEPGESLEDAVRRETLEETGIEVGEVTYFGNQPWPLPQSLMLGFVGRATSERIDLGDDELADARWVTRAELLAEAEAGTLLLPTAVSISRSLIEHWYGGPLPGHW